MAQQGYIFRRYGRWYLRLRRDFLENGVIVRRQVSEPLVDVTDRYRRESDLRELVEQKLATVRSADKCPRSSESFASYVETVYLPFVERTMKASTYAGYSSYWDRYIKPRVGKYALRDFTIAIVSNLLEDIASMHSLNIDTVGKVRSILSGIFTYAMGKGHFPGKVAADNPASRALIPETATAKKPTVAASREDVKAILAHLEAEGLTLARAAVALIAYTGVRPGEARGLRWEEWNRSGAQIKVVRSIWHAIEGTPKTTQSVRFVPVTDDLRAILLALWQSQGCPISGFILSRPKGKTVNLDNMSKRDIIPALARCAICHESESANHEGHEFDAPSLSRCGICQESQSAEHEGHTFVRDDSISGWQGWYSLRRFHGTQVRTESNLETTSKALGNSKAVADKHYIKPDSVLPDVRRAVNGAMRGLTQ